MTELSPETIAAYKKRRKEILEEQRRLASELSVIDYVLSSSKTQEEEE